MLPWREGQRHLEQIHVYSNSPWNRLKPFKDGQVTSITSKNQPRLVFAGHQHKSTKHVAATRKNVETLQKLITSKNVFENTANTGHQGKRVQNIANAGHQQNQQESVHNTTNVGRQQKPVKNVFKTQQRLVSSKNVFKTQQTLVTSKISNCCKYSFYALMPEATLGQC